MKVTRKAETRFEIGAKELFALVAKGSPELCDFQDVRLNLANNNATLVITAQEREEILQDERKTP